MSAGLALIATGTGFGLQPAMTSAANYALVEASLTKVEDVTAEIGSSGLCVDEAKAMCFDGAFRWTYTVERTLIGPKTSGRFSEVIESARPKLGLPAYLIVSHSDKMQELEWSGSSRHGLCMDDRDIRKFGLSSFALKHPCQASDETKAALGAS